MQFFFVLVKAFRNVYDYVAYCNISLMDIMIRSIMTRFDEQATILEEHKKMSTFRLQNCEQKLRLIY